MIAVRVATNNNFNCTPAEWSQLQQFEEDRPNDIFFINSNIKTPKLKSINRHHNKTVITVNPDIIPNNSDLRKLEGLDPEKIGFLRVKWIPDHPEINDLIRSLAKSYPVVVTLQRFNGKKSLLKYTSLDHYEFDCSRYRLHGSALQEIEDLVDSLGVWICDRSGGGCLACGQCAQLTTGQDLPVSSLNLSSSGLCPYSCPDCYAKTMQNFAMKMGHKPLVFNRIKKNTKQSGRTVHILRSQKRA